LCEQLQHFLFAWGESLWWHFLLLWCLISQALEQANHELLIQHRFAAQNTLYSRNQFMLGHIFEYITRSSCLERLEEILRILMYGYQYHASPLALLFDGTARGQAILYGHAHVNQGEIGLQATAEHQCLVPIGGLAYYLQSPLTSEHGTQASPGKLMVIGNHQTRWFLLSPE